MEALSHIHISKTVSQKSQTVALTDMKGQEIWKGSVKPQELLGSITGWKATRKNNHLTIPGTSVKVLMPKNTQGVQVVVHDRKSGDELGRVNLFEAGKRRGRNGKTIASDINFMLAGEVKPKKRKKEEKALPAPAPELKSAPTPFPGWQQENLKQHGEETYSPTNLTEVEVSTPKEPKKSSFLAKLAGGMAALASVTGVGYFGLSHLGKVPAWLPKF